MGSLNIFLTYDELVVKGDISFIMPGTVHIMMIFRLDSSFEIIIIYFC